MAKIIKKINVENLEKVKDKIQLLEEENYYLKERIDKSNSNIQWELIKLRIKIQYIIIAIISSLGIGLGLGIVISQFIK